MGSGFNCVYSVGSYLLEQFLLFVLARKSKIRSALQVTSLLSMHICSSSDRNLYLAICCFHSLFSGNSVPTVCVLGIFRDNWIVSMDAKSSLVSEKKNLQNFAIL